MERKIGEIFEFKKDWYQCVEGRCKDCHFSEKRFLCKQFITKYFCTHGIIFKKLEKVGEAYSIGTHIFQRYKVFIKPYIFNDPFFTVNTAIDDEFISIEIKQNEEVMEEIEWKTEKIEQYPRGKRPKISGQEELNLKPFDLEAAKQGKPVCTRDGRKARIICFDRDWDMHIVALIADPIGETVHYYLSNGKVDFDKPNDEDLMMLPEKKEGWVNVYHDKEGNIYTDENIFSSKEQAFTFCENDKYKIATVKICWEE